MKKMLSVLKSKRFSQAYNGLLVFGAILGAALPVHAGNPSGALPQLCRNGSCAGVDQALKGIDGYTSDGTRMDIYQGANTANLNWKSFDIGTGNTVQFHQPGAEAVAINKIFANDPSKIYGNLIANGNVYLINANGMLFGENSRVNVRSLITSTLDIQRDENGDPIAIGLAYKDGKAAFEHDGNTPMGMIRIEDGAILTTEGVDKDGNPFEAGGRIMIFAPQIENSGEINTPEGQTILAASEDKVYLRSFDGDKNIRGFFVEVNTGGDVKNLGKIIAEKGGNITLLGMAVNQSGLLQSTTTVAQNGSIKIIARDTVKATDTSKKSGENWLDDKLASNTGTVTFGEGSITQVVPDSSDNTKVVDDLPQLESWVEAVAREISVEKDAQIRVTGGRIDLLATDKPVNHNINAKTDNRIYLAQGSVLDVSGSTQAKEDIERNVVEVELRSNELKDSPLQRNGALRGETVYVDIREGTDLADISGAVGGIERGVDERLADGGEINLSSDGDVLVEQGAAIDISGGQIEYQDGYISTTQLLKDGEIVDISAADKNVRYDGLAGSYTRIDQKWGVTETWQVNGADTKARFEAGYIEGKDAGSLNINGNALVMEGTINANVIPGTYQRDGSAGDHTAIPKGGSVAIDLRNSNGAVQNVIFSQIIDPILKSYVTTPPPQEYFPDLQLSTQMIKDSGASSLKLHTYGDIDIDRGEQITLASGANLQLVGGTVNIDGKIKVAGGDINLAAQYATGKTAEIPAVNIGSTAVIDVRGNWVNDSPELYPQGNNMQPVYSNGGSVYIKSFTKDEDSGKPDDEAGFASGDIVIQDGAIIDASGGAWLKQDGTLVAGQGGSIKMFGKNVDPDGELLAAGLEQGGSLKIITSSVRITDGEQQPQIGELVVTPDLFNQGGFSSYSLESKLGGITVEAGTEIDLVAQNLRLDSGYALQQSGDNIESFSTLTTLPEWQRGPTSISLTVATGDLITAENGNKELYALDIGQGTKIATENGGTISLSSNQNMFMDGTLESHGGEITLTLSDDRVLSAYEKLGYIASQGIWLGESAQIDVSAAAVTTPNDFGLRSGKLFDAGSITIDAQQGYVIAQQGSNLDVSGTSAVFDANGIRADGTIGLTEQQVAADAGSVTIKSAEGVIFNGTMQAHAADVIGARGGILTVINNAQIKETALADNRNMPNKLVDHLANPGIIHLHNNDFTVVYASGTPISDEMNGVAHINSSMIEDGGFDSLNLVTTNIYEQNFHSEIGKVVIDDGVNLHLRDSLKINTTDLVINGDVELGGTYTAIGRFSSPELRVDLFETYTGSLFSGNGSLSVRSDHIDLLGEFQISGAEQVNLNSSGDIRLNGSTFVSGTSADFDSFVGELVTSANLNLNARQVYATTLTDYNLTIADNPEAVVTIGRPEGVSSEDSGAPIMSVGSNITITAPQIIQNGVLKAPGGEVTLQSGYLDSAGGDNGELVLLTDSESDISSTVSLAEDSITSVALEHQYNLFGYVDRGLDWLYHAPQNQNDYLITDLPQKKISIDAVDVELAQDAVVDISSSGDLYAYEFVPGIGGSTDVLVNDNADGSFAIIPAANNPYGFNDPGVYAGFAYEPGSQVYLSGMNGLAAGNYTILPARYALLPGAYLVTPTNHSSGILPGQTQYRVDGASIIAGKYSVAGTGITDSLWSGFVVEPGSIARTRSEYFDYLATPFFSAKALAMGETVGRMPIDAGHLALSAVDTLIIQNTLHADPAAGGKGAWIDIDTPNIKVYSDQQQLPDNVTTQGLTAEVDGSIYISAQGLNNLGADSILLGGTRNTAVNGTQLDVGAATVEVMSGTELNGNEILLAAQDKVTVAKNAAVIASGDKAVRDETINIVGDGALLRASAADQIQLVRSGVTATKGELVIEQGAMVSASGAMLLQGTQDTILHGAINVGTQQQAGSLYLGASQISLSNDRNIDAGGLILPTSMLEQFNLDELVLSSYGALNIYNGVDLKLNNLKLEAAAINGIDNQGSVANISVTDTLTLVNPHQSDINFAGDVFNENGTLNISAGQIVLGSDAINSNEDYISQNMLINGFNNISMTAASGAVGKGDMHLGFGNTGTNAIVTLSTPMLTVASGSSLSLNATNSALNLNSANSDPTIPAAIGGKLALSADSVDIGSKIDMSGGLVNINATNDIDINGSIDVSGQEKLFYDKTEYIPAGMVSLSSENGDVNINPLTAEEGDIARIDISSGSETGGKAGTLAISAAKGKANLGGTIAAHGVENGGSFLLDVGSHSDFDTLFATLNQSGFDNQIAVRLRNGDMNIGAVSTTVNGRDITLAADQGSISLDQVTIDASGDISAAGKGGEVAIWAGQDLNIGANTRITTVATVADKDGGDILLASQSGTVAIDNAARFYLGGFGNGRGGDLQIRAERSADDVKVVLFDAKNVVAGADAVRIEAFSKYEVDSTLDAGDIAGIKGDTATFMTNCNNNGLCEQWSDNGVVVMPGVDVIAGGDLTLTADWDLADWRYADANGENTIPGQLTIRTPGSIYLNKDLTDGIKVETTMVGREKVEKHTALAGETWAYRINAGADLASANKLQIDKSLQDGGDLVIASDTKLRTGSGDIDIAISGDLELTDQTSVIYTFGQAQNSGALEGLKQSDANKFFSGQYLDNGGDISINAGGEIIGAISDQLQTAWQHRVWTGYLGGESTDGIPTVWAIDIGNFEQGIAALGGGDIDVHADGDIKDLNLSVASSRRFDGEMEFVRGRPGYFNYYGSDTTMFGGGSLNVSAAGDIKGGVFSNDFGTTSIVTNSSIENGPNTLSPIMMMMDSEYSVSALHDLSLQGVLNPTWVYHVKDQPYIVAAGKTNGVFYYSYSADSSIDLNAISGEIELINSPDNIENSYNIFGGDQFSYDNTAPGKSVVNAWNMYPSMTDVTAFAGSILLHGDLTIFPTAYSTLNLLAQEDISTVEGSKIIIPDLDQGIMPSYNSPVRYYKGNNSEISISDYLNFYDDAGDKKPLLFSDTPTHIDDFVPNRIIALNGSFGSLDQAGPLQFFSAKPATIVAGEDIHTATIYIQNLRDTDTSVVQAAGDISFFQLDTDGNAAEISNSGIKLAGPGNLDVIAGGDIDLASSKGIYSVGNKENPALAETGADITVMAGVGDSVNRTDYADFIDRYLDQDTFTGLQQQVTDLMRSYSGNSSMTYEEAIEQLQILPAEISDLLIDSGIGNSLPLGINSKNLLSYMGSLQNYRSWLGDYLTAQGVNATEDFAAMVQTFEQLPVYKQRELVMQIFFNELKEGGKDGVTKGAVAYDRGYAAVYELYQDYAIDGYDISSQDNLRHFLSQGTSFDGELSMYSSKIQTEDGGDINILVPGGRVFGGLPAASGEDDDDKKATGVVAFREGDVNAFTRNDFLVNQSRVFAMDGGDILMWSSETNLDAGRGAKTARGVSEALYQFDDWGNVRVLPPESLTGSGIRAFGGGDVLLFAPIGVVDAGDAGIGTAGNLFVGATEVKGADNFDIGGVAVGVQVTTQGDVSGMTSAGDVTSGATNSALEQVEGIAEEKSVAEEQLSWLEVFVEGLGNEGSLEVEVEDEEEDEEEKKKKKKKKSGKKDKKDKLASVDNISNRQQRDIAPL